VDDSKPKPLDRARLGNQHGITPAAGQRFGAYARTWGKSFALIQSGYAPSVLRMPTSGDMKVLGRRRQPQATPENMEAIQKLALDLRGPRRLFVPKGVYRFKSHQEADEWLMTMLTRPSRESS
jgi:hypothetical protein